MREAVGMREQLNRLLRLSEQENEEPEEVRKLKIDDIEVNPYQPRKFFDDSALEELAESIRTYGVIQPLVVKKAGEKYRLIAGERRWRASRLAGLTHVPALVKNYRTSDEPLLALVENVQRKDLNYLEEAISYQKILEDYNITQQELAVKVGKSQAYIANKVRLLNLPSECLIQLVENNLSERHARALLKVDSEEEMRRILAVVIEEQLNVRDTERMINGENIEPAPTVEEMFFEAPFENPAEIPEVEESKSAVYTLNDVAVAPRRRGRGPGVPSLDKYLNRIASVVNAMNEHGFNVIDSIEKKEGGIIVKIMIDAQQTAMTEPDMTAKQEEILAKADEMVIQAEETIEEADVIEQEEMPDPDAILALKSSLAKIELIDADGAAEAASNPEKLPIKSDEAKPNDLSSRHPALFILDDEEELFKDIATLKED